MFKEQAAASHSFFSQFYGSLRRALILSVISLFASQIFAQTYRAPIRQNNLSRRSAFRQEIARLNITVERAGQIPLPMSLVPRIREGDILRVQMLDEPINGIRPSDSYWDWTLTVAFINPSRNEVAEESVSREIYFKRDGWYRDHAFKVPYDSQPVFFLYPKPKYRKKIKKLINKNFREIRKIGEKTLEIAGAYAQIGMFLNELQRTINQNPYGNSGGYNPYGGYNNYSYGGRNSRSPYGEGFVKNQIIERLAQSFNIALPSCWRAGTGTSSYFNQNDFVGRAQCVAKNVRLEDFDFSVNRMLQQGGLLAATKLVEKYPQLAYWINVAAAAADLIIKIMRKTPLKIVPTMASGGGNNQGYSQYNQYGHYSNNQYGLQNRLQLRLNQKISLHAEKPPTDSDFVTAFPVVLHKWQSEPDPEVISLPIPSLMEPCLHMGQNILKNTDLSYDWLRDPFARDFRLIMSSDNGFSKEFRLIKNMGMSGWMMMLNPQDLQSFPKVKMAIKSKVVATRGFSQIESKEFSMPISGGGKWEVSRESFSGFSVGGKRRIVIKNTMGSCRCLQSVKFRPSFGGEFTFIANASSNPLMFSDDGTEAWFDIDTTYFQPGQGNLELRTYGTNQPQNIPVKLFPLPPEITKFGVHKGDRKITIEGNRIEQIKMVSVDGKMARLNTSVQNRTSRSGRKSKEFVFQNPNDIILSRLVSVELHLEGNRRYKYPDSFPVLPARPTIEANKKKEIEALVVGWQKSSFKFDLSSYPVVPVDSEKMTVDVKTTLADYGFKAENISIETRIENGQVVPNALPKTTFEVLDSFNLQINFVFDKQHRQFFGGRRLQFRIKDKIRGTSDWYTTKQTFIRIPQIDSVSCQNGGCKITGKGLQYIGKISVDGGSAWLPPSQLQPTPDGRAVMTISSAKVRGLIRIKLRDYPSTDGLPLR